MPSRARSAPGLVVGAIVVVSAALFVRLASGVSGPDVFGDELFYLDAASSLAHGEGLSVRDTGYGLGPAYPVLLAPLVAFAGDRSAAYDLILAANALVIATLALPVYLLARRIMTPWPSVAASGVAALLPISFYAGYVMTESFATVAATWSLLAIQRAVERPTVGRQLLVLAACAVAASFRTQLAVLFLGYLLALGLAQLAIGRRPPLAVVCRRLWPTLAAVAAGVLVVSGLLASGRSPSTLLGDYAVLWSSYDLGAVARWTAYHVLDVALYLVVVPVLIMPGVLRGLWLEARAGSTSAAAFTGVFVASNMLGLLVVGAFGSTSFGEGRIHDRYVLYLFPLWAVLFVLWVQRGAQRHRPSILATAAILAALAVWAPLSRLVVFTGSELFDGVGTALWAALSEIGGIVTPTSSVLVGIGLASLVVLLVPPRQAWLVVVGVALVLGTINWGMWGRAMSVGGKGAFETTSSEERLWVDRSAHGRRATTLLVDNSCATRETRSAFLVTEFFNDAVEGSVRVGRPHPVPLPERLGRIAADGTILDTTRGEPIRADLVVAEPSVTLDGLPIASGTTSRLRLWSVRGTLRVLPSSRRCP